MGYYTQIAGHKGSRHFSISFPGRNLRKFDFAPRVSNAALRKVGVHVQSPFKEGGKVKVSDWAISLHL